MIRTLLLLNRKNPAVFLGELSSQGTIERGKLANLILLDANPLENITNTQRINAVVHNGRFLAKETLQKMLADIATAAQEK
jgi:imidazolonepropionase-like amidohydrolase